MSQTWNTFSTASTKFGNHFDKLQESLDALKTQFGGEAQPPNPVVGQPWIELNSSNKIVAIKIYDGTNFVDWKEHSGIKDIETEVVSARMNATTLYDLLSVSLNPDGTIKGDAPAGEWWMNETEPVAYNGANVFSVTGVDHTAIYEVGRAIKLNQDVDGYGFVTNSSFVDGNTLVTVDCLVDTGIAAVEFGQPKRNTPISDLYCGGLSASGSNIVLESPNNVVIDTIATPFVVPSEVTEFTKQQTFISPSISASGSYSWDLDSQVIELTCTADVDFTTPTNMKNGGCYRLEIIPNEFIISGWSADFEWGAIGAPSISTRTIIVFDCDGSKMRGTVFYQE